MCSKNINQSSSYFERHPEQAFILKSLVFVVFLYILKLYVFNTLYALFFPFLFAPIFYWIFLNISPSENGKSAARRFLENITFFPAPITEGEYRQEEIPWATYLLILINILIYYGIQLPHLEYFRNNLICLPYRPEIWNLIVSPVSSMFLHGSQEHLWGNMFFLWAFGVVLEKRIGWKRFLLIYLLSGLVSCLGFLNVYTWIMGRYPHLLGASGAISGVLGTYAIRCYFKTLQLPLPLLGLLSIFYPLYLKVRINAFVLIGLFFVSDLSRGLEFSVGRGGVAYFVHIFGLLSGFGCGYLLRLHNDAIEERHLDIGHNPLAAGFGLQDKRLAYQRVLEQNANNLEAKLELARIASAHCQTEEGRNLYLEVITEQLKIAPKQATAIFHEYLCIYWQRCDAELQYRIAQITAKQGQLERAARYLNMLVEDKSVEEELRGKAMYQEAKLLLEMGQEQASREYMKRFIEQFPTSVFSGKAKKIILES